LDWFSVVSLAKRTQPDIEDTENVGNDHCPAHNDGLQRKVYQWYRTFGLTSFTPALLDLLKRARTGTIG
jgi:hypothetical protein